MKGGARSNTSLINELHQQGRIEHFVEPMFVLTYISDQHNPLVTRTEHFMNGFYMQAALFLNVIYQKTLDVLDVPFQIEKNVRIPTAPTNSTS